jgi:hypothetical protein
VAALALHACGGILGNADGAAKLTIKNITMKDLVTGTDGTTMLRFFPHEAVYDTGCDMIWGNNSLDGEGDGFPQPCEMQIKEFPILNDMITIEVLNEPRLGVKTPVDFIVYRVAFTYLDRGLHPRSFMPRNVQNVNVRVGPDEAIKFQVLAVPETYKSAPGGLRDIFLYGDSKDNMYGDVIFTEKDMASSWTVYVDIDAMDPENGDTIHSQAVTTFTFENPIPLLGEMTPET